MFYCFCYAYLYGVRQKTGGGFKECPMKSLKR